MFSGGLVTHFLFKQILILWTGYIRMFRYYDTFVKLPLVRNFVFGYRDLNKNPQVLEKDFIFRSSIETKINKHGVKSRGVRSS